MGEILVCNPGMQQQDMKPKAQSKSRSLTGRAFEFSVWKSCNYVGVMEGPLKPHTAATSLVCLERTYNYRPALWLNLSSAGTIGLITNNSSQNS